MGQGQPAPLRFQAWRRFLEAHATVVPRVDQELQREVHLPFTWYDVLFQLASAEGRLRMGELADAVLLSRSGLTRLVDRIEAAGLVARQAIPGDRRGSHVALTEAGVRRLAAARPVASRAIEAHFGSRLSDGEARVLMEALGRMRSGGLRSGS